MSTAIKNVAVAGATGLLGPHVITALHASGFSVTILTRSPPATLPAGVSSARAVDYSSPDSLASALEGQHAVVSTLSGNDPAPQIALLRAAAAPGSSVVRFIPSEFGSNTIDLKARGLPVYAPKLAVQKALEETCGGDARLSYSIVQTGPFLNWGLDLGWIMNAKERKVVLYDGGDVRFSTTTLPTVGKAVAGVLGAPDQTKNRVVRVQEANLTLEQLLGLGKKAVGEGKGWEAPEAATDGIISKGFEELQTGDIERAMMKFILAACFGRGYGQDFGKDNDNALLGITELTDDQLVALIKQAA